MLLHHETRAHPPGRQPILIEDTVPRPKGPDVAVGVDGFKPEITLPQTQVSRVGRLPLQSNF